jgi:uncharacterized protein (TIGR03084 family)
VAELDALVADLDAEQALLRDVVSGLDDDAWLTPTPAWSWDVRDTIAHLAHTDEMAIATVHETDGAIMAVAARSAAGEDVTYRGVMRGRRLSGPEVLEWWEGASAAERALLSSLAPSRRVAWGIGMSATSFVTARLMETWAHGLDVRAALGVEAVDTDRLAHIAWLATRALPYAYSIAGEVPPDAPLFVDLTLPSGAHWTFGTDNAADCITGPAGEYCRVFVHRARPADTTLEATGDNARHALEVARAFL